MRHVDRPAPRRLVSRRLRLLAAGRPTGLPAAGLPTAGLPAAGRPIGLLTVSGLLTVTGLLSASRGAAGVPLIRLFQGDLFPDSLPFPGGFLISRFLAGGLAGPRVLAGGSLAPVSRPAGSPAPPS